MPRTAFTCLLLATLASTAPPALSKTPPPPMPQPDPDLPWEADWDFRRDTALDGNLDKEAAEYRLRLYDCGEGWKGRTFWKEQEQFDVTAEVKRPFNGGTVILLRSETAVSSTVYVGSRTKDGGYAGTWHDHRGNSGDWEMKLRKEVAPLYVHGVTSTATYDPDAVWEGAKLPPHASGPTPARGFVVSAVDGSGKVVKSVTSGDRGRYQLSLHPGKYTITVESPDAKKFPHCHPNKVAVEVKETSSHRLDIEASNVRR